MPNRRACKASGWVPGRLPARAQFGQALHGPDVVLVAQGAEESFPQRLLPADSPGAGLELRGLALQAHVRRLVEQVQQLRRRHGAQRGAAFAAQVFRQRLAPPRRPATSSARPSGASSACAQQERGRRSGGRLLALPNHVQDDVLEGGIAVMAVRAPAAGTKVHLHVAGPRRPVADLHDRARGNPGRPRRCENPDEGCGPVDRPRS